MPGSVVKASNSNRRHSGKNRQQRIAEGEALLADHVRGMRQTDLAKKYGISIATVERRIRAALDSRVATTVDEFRAKRNVSLEEQMAGWQKNLEVAEALGLKGVEEQDVGLILKAAELRSAALAGMLRVDDRAARLNGADAPVRAEVEVVQVTAQEKELRDLLEQASREQAAREALLTEAPA